MGQTLTIGSVTLDPDAAWFRIHRTGILGQTNRLNRVRNKWIIDGRLNSDPGLQGTAAQASLDAKVVAFENAIVPGVNIVFSLGASMRLISSYMVGGTQIESFDWLTGYDGVRGSGAEGLLRRTFHLVVYGDNAVNADTAITGLFETIQQIGTGIPRTVPVGSLAGTVQPQTVQLNTPIWCIQSGYAIGQYTWPTAPIPLYQGVAGVYYDPNTLTESQDTPQQWGRNTNMGYRTRWSYRAWSTISLGVGPTIIP